MGDSVRDDMLFHETLYTEQHSEKASRSQMTGGEGVGVDAVARDVMRSVNSYSSDRRREGKRR